MADLGKAYVQIIPKAEGITDGIGKIIDPASEKAGKRGGESAGKSFGSSLKSALLKVGIGAAVVKGFQSALSEGGKLQQSYGGLETIYGDAADAAKKYAAEAAQAGISANDYAEQAVSFGASLKQAFEGDTTKAVEAANTAIMDMTDNAAKMGTPIESIQNAYQGFAKGNYTMLDNLKLGYGGTKTEMERLLQDAQKLSGVEYNIDNLGDVYDAIHVIQGDLGLTGVAAKEASETFSGSFEAMKAAASNLMGNLALGENVDESMSTLVESVVNFLGNNLIPMVGTVLTSLPEAIKTAITTGGPVLLKAGGELLTNIVNGISENLPTVLSEGSDVVNNVIAGIQENLPTLLEKGSELLSSLLNSITENLPTVLEKGGEILTNIVNGILEAIPQMSEAAGELINKLGDFIAENLPTIGEKGGELLGKLAEGLIQNMPAIMTALAKLSTIVLQNIIKLLPKLLQMGGQLIRGLASGLGGSALSAVSTAIDKVKSALTKPIESAKDTIKNIMDKIKGFFPLSIGRIFSNLQLPHISVSGGSPPYGIAGKGVKPSFSVEWYAKAKTQPYLFDRPTLFGAGDVSDEMLYGRTNLMRDIREAMGGSGAVTNTFNIYVDGAEDPEAWASRAMRQLKMEARMA